MIQWERPDPHAKAHPTMYRPPNTESVAEFERGMEKYYQSLVNPEQVLKTEQSAPNKVEPVQKVEAKAIPPKKTPA